MRRTLTSLTQILLLTNVRGGEAAPAQVADVVQSVPEVH